MILSPDGCTSMYQLFLIPDTTQHTLISANNKNYKTPIYLRFNAQLLTLDMLTKHFKQKNVNIDFLLTLLFNGSTVSVSPQFTNFTLSVQCSH